jgi:hypothetical protein
LTRDPDRGAAGEPREPEGEGPTPLGVLRQYRVLAIVAAGFLAGVAFLFFIVATDL